MQESGGANDLVWTARCGVAHRLSRSSSKLVLSSHGYLCCFGNSRKPGKHAPSTQWPTVVCWRAEDKDRLGSPTRRRTRCGVGAEVPNEKGSCHRTAGSTLFVSAICFSFLVPR